MLIDLISNFTFTWFNKQDTHKRFKLTTRQMCLCKPLGILIATHKKFRI